MKEKLQFACEEGQLGVRNQEGGPFGAIITDKNGTIISKGHNTVLLTKDPTNHAEIVAIREACKKLGTNDLKDYIIYSSCEPCPMCLSAIIWSNISTIYYGATRLDAEQAGFRDNKIYDFLAGKNEILKRIEVKETACQDLLKNYEGEIY